MKQPGARPPDFDPSEAAVVELQALNREGRLKSGDIEADRPGRSFESAGTKRHAMSRNVDPKNKRRSRLLTVSPSVWKRCGATASGSNHTGCGPGIPGNVARRCHRGAPGHDRQEVNLDLAQMTPQEIRKQLPDRYPAHRQSDSRLRLPVAWTVVRVTGAAMLGGVPMGAGYPVTAVAVPTRFENLIAAALCRH